MTLSVDPFWSFRSPTSYLALSNQDAEARHQIRRHRRPASGLSAGGRVPGFFKRADPHFAKYVVLDSLRVAMHENIPFRFPQPDPIIQNMTTVEVALGQPCISRLTRLGAAAQHHGRAPDFVSGVATVLWDGSNMGWHKANIWQKRRPRRGVDLAAMDAAFTADSDHYEQIIATNEQDHAASGH